MKRRERQLKLHDSLINVLYAPPSPPPHRNEFDEQTLTLAREIANSDHHRINTCELEGEEERSLSSSSEEEGGSGSQKLTRAQRKRLRKKKLKEVASHRRLIIGPQLPSTGGDDQIDGDGSDGPEYQQSEGVRRNVAEGPESGNNHNFSKTLKPCSASSGGETPSTIKVKHRRMSKKKARDKTKTTDLCHEASSPADKIKDQRHGC
ncbi:uncharacterized protein LOC112528551 isoform X2 [Cynara cardunculus var. scolymus]|uniref:Uncharacterized protein n=1 Tax=Cynara cardunculus var. scolymus TaxID=59895 RepID=A0A103YH00_CYNCS|nr:uncharacterized protein LOC112528551 isoform X2 [Cynara cardunculus var. scolymus]KVI08929.1 hypothetical protein Ccrd_012693 [Cynara cardunculus var. scolymus]